MKATPRIQRALLLITSHALLVSVFTNQYFYYLLLDLSNILSGNTDAVVEVIHTQLTQSLALVSFTSAFTAFGAFAVYSYFKYMAPGSTKKQSKRKTTKKK